MGVDPSTCPLQKPMTQKAAVRFDSMTTAQPAPKAAVGSPCEASASTTAWGGGASVGHGRAHQRLLAPQRPTGGSRQARPAGVDARPAGQPGGGADRGRKDSGGGGRHRGARPPAHGTLPERSAPELPAPCWPGRGAPVGTLRSREAVALAAHRPLCPGSTALASQQPFGTLPCADPRGSGHCPPPCSEHLFEAKGWGWLRASSPGAFLPFIDDRFHHHHPSLKRLFSEQF